MATESKTESNVNVPPYIPFATLSGFIGRLKDTTVPAAIDKSLMTNIANGMQSYLLGAMRFLGLTEGKNNTVTPALDKLVESHGTEGYKATLAVIIQEAYAEVIQNLDLTKATAKQLDDAFGKYSLDGVVRDRAIRFYLKALTEADIKFSPHLGKRKPRGSAGNGKPRKSPAAAVTANNTTKSQKAVDDEEQPQEGTQKYPLYFKGKASGSLIVPTDLTLADCTVIELQLAVLKAYATPDGGK